MKTIKVTLEKLREVQSPAHPNNIPEGDVKEFEIPEGAFRVPTLHVPFYPSLNYRTSIVEAIIDEETFITRNSVYRWKAIELPK